MVVGEKRRIEERKAGERGKLHSFKMAATKRVVVYGGRGALGASCVKSFKAKSFVSKFLRSFPIFYFYLETKDCFVIVLQIQMWVIWGIFFI